MFGYVRTDLPYLYGKDLVLYKSMYCGLCKAIGKTCGTKGRFTLNYDLAFLSVLVHNVLDKDVKIEKQTCVLHTIKKRPIAQVDELSERVGALNVILAHYKLLDDKLDEKKGGFTNRFIRRSYKKALKKEPVLDNIVREMYAKLVKLEKIGTDSIDKVADPFGSMMANIVKELTKEAFSEPLEVLSYNVGKWVYLIDALDDFDKDKKKKNFNVFINLYKEVQTKEELIQTKKYELTQIFNPILFDIRESNSQVEYKFNHDLIDNILVYGLSAQTKKVMENSKCKKHTKS